MLYFGTGAFTGDHKAAQAVGAEHAALVKVFTSFLRFRGFTVTGWGALVFTGVGYCIDARRRAVVGAKIAELWRGWFGSPKPARPEQRVEPVPAPTGDATPAHATVEPPASAAPVDPNWTDRLRRMTG